MHRLGVRCSSAVAVIEVYAGDAVHKLARCSSARVGTEERVERGPRRALGCNVAVVGTGVVGDAAAVIVSVSSFGCMRVQLCSLGDVGEESLPFAGGGS